VEKKAISDSNLKKPGAESKSKLEKKSKTRFTGKTARISAAALPRR